MANTVCFVVVTPFPGRALSELPRMAAWMNSQLFTSPASLHPSRPGLSHHNKVWLGTYRTVSANICKLCIHTPVFGPRICNPRNL